MKNYAKKLLFGLLVFVPLLSNAQKDQVPMTRDLTTLTPTERMKTLRVIHQGTYQIQVLSSNLHPLITPSIMDLVSSSRLMNEDVVLDIEAGIKLYLPSTSSISTDNFESLEEIAFLSSPPIINSAEE